MAGRDAACVPSPRRPVARQQTHAPGQGMQPFEEQGTGRRKAQMEQPHLPDRFQACDRQVLAATNKEFVQQEGQRMRDPGDHSIENQSNDRQHPGPAPALLGVPRLARSPPSERAKSQAGQRQQHCDGEKGPEQHYSPVTQEAPPE